MRPKYHLQAGVLTLFGYRILFVNLMEAMDPLFRKMCVCMHIHAHTSFSIQFLRSFQTLCSPSAFLLGHSLRLHTSRHRDLATSNSRPSLAGQLWI